MTEKHQLSDEKVIEDEREGGREREETGIKKFVIGNAHSFLITHFSIQYHW